MPGVYDRKMFRMQAGGMMPPEMPPEMAMAPPMDPAMAMMPPPDMGMMPPPMDPAMAMMPPPDMEQMVDQGMEDVISAEVDRTKQDIDMAGSFGDLMNVVWDEGADIEQYRARLADVVGPEDAARTPDSVLTLVQPTLQLAQIDQGIGALMQEELAGMGGAGEGITSIAPQESMADGMAAQTGALVDAVGNMAQGPGPMDMEAEAMEMDPMMIEAMLQGAGPTGQGMV
jgi:hypothetical protein